MGAMNTNTPSHAQSTAPRSKFLRGVFLGVFGACCWGFSGVCVNFLTSGYGVSSPWLGFMRLTLAGIIFAIAAVLADKNNLLGLLRDRKAMISVTLFALFGMALYQISYIMAIHTAGAATESLLCEMSLIYIMVFSCIHEHRRPRRSELAAIVLAVAGVYCIATKGDPSTIAIGLVGLAWCALDGVLQFLHNVLPLDALERYGSLSVNAVGMLIGGMILAPVAQPWFVQVSFDGAAWAAFIGTVIIGAAFGYLFSMQALKDAGPVIGSLTLVFEPIAAVVASAVILGTTFCAFDFIGGACIISMMVVVTLADARRSSEQALNQAAVARIAHDKASNALAPSRTKEPHARP